LAWVFFRAADFAAALEFISHLFTGTNTFGLPLMQMAVIGFCVLLHGAERSLRTQLPSLRSRLAQKPWGSAPEGAVLGVLIGGAIVTSGVGGDFIYFQF
jgi:hypothetical protein